MDAYETNCNQILGLWQLTPTKQESRPEIQDVSKKTEGTQS
mgnify:CR=1 FL=1